MLGGQFLLPQREEGWKWENGILATWVWHRGLNAWGIQIGPFADCWVHFVQKIYQRFFFYSRRPIIITKDEGGRLKMRKWNSPKLSETQWISATFPTFPILQSRALWVLACENRHKNSRVGIPNHHFGLRCWPFNKFLAQRNLPYVQDLGRWSAEWTHTNE